MPEPVRAAITALLLTFVAVGGYYRIQSQRSREKLDRTQEGWPLLIGIRLTGYRLLAPRLRPERG